jgi:hypothetical protein
MTKAKRFVLLALVLGGLLLAGSPALTPQATAWDVGPVLSYNRGQSLVGGQEGVQEERRG